MSEIQVIDPFEHFRQRPSMYIGKPSLYGFQCFVAGLNSVRGGQPLFEIDWTKFNKWAIKKSKLKKRIASDAALALCNNDDKEAFYLYLDWLNEFQKEDKK